MIAATIIVTTLIVLTCESSIPLAGSASHHWQRSSACVVECSDSRQVSQGSVPQPAAATAQADDRQASAVHPQQMHPFTIIRLGAELLEYIGAHHLGVFDDWDCAHCSPRWYDWWCCACRKRVPSRWTLEDHFGQCVTDTTSLQ